VPLEAVPLRLAAQKEDLEALTRIEMAPGRGRREVGHGSGGDPERVEHGSGGTDGVAADGVGRRDEIEEAVC
jgi:hypothetical protein